MSRLLLTLLLPLAACTTGSQWVQPPPPTVPVVLPAACCRVLEEFQWRELRPGAELKLIFDQQTATLVVEGELQRTHALAFPAGITPSSLQVKSLVGHTESAQAAVFPEFIFLDEGRRTLQEAPVPPLQREDGGWRSYLQGRLVVPVAARYVLVRVSETPGSKRAPLIWTSRAVMPHTDGEVSLRLFTQ